MLNSNKDSRCGTSHHKHVAWYISLQLKTFLAWVPLIHKLEVWVQLIYNPMVRYISSQAKGIYGRCVLP